MKKHPLHEMTQRAMLRNYSTPDVEQRCPSPMCSFVVRICVRDDDETATINEDPRIRRLCRAHEAVMKDHLATEHA